MRHYEKFYFSIFFFVIYSAIGVIAKKCTTKTKKIYVVAEWIAVFVAFLIQILILHFTGIDIMVNGEYGQYGADSQVVADGDVFQLIYTVYTE